MEVAPWPKSMISAEALTAFDPISTLVVVVEMSKASWLVSGVVPGIERQPLKKLESDATALLRLIERWRKASHKITSKRREGFWEVSFPRGRTIWVNKARPTRRKIVQQTGVATLHPARELRNLQDYSTNLQTVPAHAGGIRQGHVGETLEQHGQQDDANGSPRQVRARAMMRAVAKGLVRIGLRSPW